MRRTRFVWKLYTGFMILILLTAILTGVFVARGIESDSLREIETNLKAKAVFLRNIYGESLSSGSVGSLQARVAAMGHETGTRLTVARADGVVVADSEADPAWMDNHADRPEIVAARTEGAGKSTRFSNTVKTNMMYLALPVVGDEGLVGFVRASLPLTDVSRRLAQIRNIVAFTVAVSSVVALAVGFYFARRVTRPLTTMTEAARAIAAGEYEHTLEIRSGDEIGTLSRAFNTMVQQLRSRMETILLDRNKVIAILSSMVEGVVAVDRSEKVIHLNEVAAKILDTSRESALGKSIAEIRGGEEVWEALRQTMHDVRELTRETLLRTPGGERVIQMQASPLRDGENQLAGAVVVLHDITTLRRLELVRRDFVANVSHELKTPVAAIRGLVETLIDDGQMPPEVQKNFLSRIKDQSVRLSTLVTDLLTVSRLESRDWGPETESFDLRDPVRKSFRALLPVIGAKDLVAEMDVPDDPVIVQGDPEGLRQVVDNLLDNALKYTPAGGRIWLCARAEDNSAIIEVQDTGIGIEEQHQSRIFERFYRVDKARSRELGGTGLGLAIVKHIVLGMKGAVSVKSTPGKGSLFRVQVPLAASQRKVPSPPSLFS